MIRLPVILLLLFVFNSFGTSTKTDNLTSSQMEIFRYLPENSDFQETSVNNIYTLKKKSEKNYKPGKIFDKMDVNREGKLIRFHPDLKAKGLDELKQLTLSEKKGNNFKGEIWQKKI